MNELEKTNKLLLELGFPSFDEIEPNYKSLIKCFLNEDNNPVYLLGLIMKLIGSENDANFILNDYIENKKKNTEFQRQTIDTINKQTKVIQEQTALIDKLSKQYEDAVKFMVTENSDTNTPTH
jgi:hypothetical protein